ncbi:MAG: GGDEF domain-containing protein [Bdellovibrionales bacterium]
MSVLSKEQPFPGASTVALRQGWKVFESRPVGEESGGRDAPDEGALRPALNQAEKIIRAQKDRILDLEEMMLTDELTGLANRRGFIAAFKRELAMARRDADFAGVMVMIGLDGFASVSNTWGHQTGDAYVFAAAEFLRQGVRAHDTVARWENGDFALLLTHMDELTGMKRLEKLERAFSKKTVLPENLPLHMNFGFAPYTGTSSADAVIQTAYLRLNAHRPHPNALTSVG